MLRGYLACFLVFSCFVLASFLVLSWFFLACFLPLAADLLLNRYYLADHLDLLVPNADGRYHKTDA